LVAVEHCLASLQLITLDERLAGTRGFLVLDVAFPGKRLPPTDRHDRDCALAGRGPMTVNFFARPADAWVRCRFALPKRPLDIVVGDEGFEPPTPSV
jgi:hypothetical protein